MAAEVGKKAPGFRAAGVDGDFTLHEFAGRPVVLYFYPKDMTSGCTVEACQFRDASPDFTKLNAAVLGVSPDPVKMHKKFIEKEKLNFPLLADEDHAISESYGVWVEKSMYGRRYMGIERSTFLIGGDGKIKRAWRKVSVPGHVAEVLGALREEAG